MPKTATAASLGLPGMSVSTSPRAARVFVFADIGLLREGLSDELVRRGLEVVGAAAPDRDMLSRIRELRPEVVVLEGTRGVGAIRAVHRAFPGVKVVAISVSESESDIVRYAEAGIAGYVSREGGLDELEAAIRSALGGELICPPSVAGTLLRRVATLASEEERVPRASLTPREFEVAQLLCAGLSNKEIARRLSIELSTVKNHVHSILDKLGVRRRGEAAARLVPELMLNRGEI